MCRRLRPLFRPVLRPHLCRPDRRPPARLQPEPDFRPRLRRGAAGAREQGPDDLKSRVDEHSVIHHTVSPPSNAAPARLADYAARIRPTPDEPYLSNTVGSGLPKVMTFSVPSSSIFLIRSEV